MQSLAKSMLLALLSRNQIKIILRQDQPHSMAVDVSAVCSQWIRTRGPQIVQVQFWHLCVGWLDDVLVQRASLALITVLIVVDDGECASLLLLDVLPLGLEQLRLALGACRPMQGLCLAKVSRLAAGFVALGFEHFLEHHTRL